MGQPLKQAMCRGWDSFWGRHGQAHWMAAEVSCSCAGWFLAIIYMVAGIPLGWWLW